MEARQHRRRRRGGIRQRQADEDSSSPDRSRSPCQRNLGGNVSSFSDCPHQLLKDFAWGQVSGPRTQEKAHSVVRECRKVLNSAGVPNPDQYLSNTICRIAMAGNWGNSSHNAANDLLEDFGLHRGQHLIQLLPDSEIADSIVSPSQFFKWLHQDHFDHWKQRFGARRNKLRDWWQKFFRTPGGARMKAKHPHLIRRQNWDTTIPINFHVDAGPVAKKNSAVICSWGAHHWAASGSEKQTRNLAATWISKKHLARTQNGFWVCFQAELELLQSGRDNGGQLLAPLERGSDVGWTCVLVKTKADLKEQCDEWGFKSFSSADEPCGLCRGNRSTRPWNIFSESADWVNTIYDHDAFVAFYTARDTHHPIWDWAGNGPDMTGIDLLHTTDDKGVSNFFCANLFQTAIQGYELADTDGSYPRSQERQLVILNRKIKEFQSADQEENRFPTLKLQNLYAQKAHSRNYPQLHGQGIKAANTRCLVKFAKSLAAALDDGTRLKSERRKCADHLFGFYDVVYSAGELLDLANSFSVNPPAPGRMPGGLRGFGLRSRNIFMF